MEIRSIQEELRVLEAFPSSYLITKRESHFGLVLHVEITAALLAGLREDSVAFDVHLPRGFPALPPVVNCVTHFTSPSIADGRDLTRDAINGPWNEESSLYDVISGLPDLVRHCLLDVSPMALSIEIGTFHLGQSMYLSQWSNKDTLGYFSCVEVTKKGEERRALVVTETVILQLEPSTTYVGTGVLLSWATLQSLANIKRSKSQPHKVTFDWKVIKDNPEYSQTFIIEDVSACISLITSNMSHLGVLVKRQNAIIEANLKEEEVTKQSLQSIHINDVLHAITVYEANLDEKLTLDMVNSLMGLYQKAVEYFSGVGDPRYDEFLARLHSMLSNTEIQKVLSGEKERIAGEIEEKEGKLEEIEGKIEEKEGKLEEIEGKIEVKEGNLEEIEGKKGLNEEKEIKAEEVTVKIETNQGGNRGKTEVEEKKEEEKKNVEAVEVKRQEEIEDLVLETPEIKTISAVEDSLPPSQEPAESAEAESPPSN